MDLSPEKLCLKWGEFQENIISSYHNLRRESEYSDVTLVCEEDQYIKAHKIILTACSPFCSTILKKTEHFHPIIYMRGMKAKDLASIVDFVYHREANVYQEDLEGFLSLAEELKVKGLARSQSNTKEPSENAKEELNGQNSQQKTTLKQENCIEPIEEGEDLRDTTQNDSKHLIQRVDTRKLILATNTTMEDLR